MMVKETVRTPVRDVSYYNHLKKKRMIFNSIERICNGKEKLAIPLLPPRLLRDMNLSEMRRKHGDPQSSS